MSINKAIKYGVLSDIFGKSKAEETAGRCREMGLLDRYSRQFSAEDLATLLFALGCSGRTDKVYRVMQDRFKAEHKDEAYPEGINLIDFIATLLQDPQRISLIDKIVFNDNPGGEVLYRYTGRVDLYNWQQWSEANTRTITGEQLVHLSADYIKYSQNTGEE